jgi:hypothetical protein
MLAMLAAPELAEICPGPGDDEGAKPVTAGAG